MREYLPHIFHLFFAVSCLVFVLAASRWRNRLYALNGHFFLVTLALFPLAFFFLSWGLRETSLGKAAPMLVAGGAVLVVALALQAFAIHKFIRAGEVGARP